MRDWVGNCSVRNTNIRTKDADPNDYYATEPRAVELLLEQEKFSPVIWECACGEGHISKVLEKNGYKVISTDFIDRGYGLGGCDFLGDLPDVGVDFKSVDIVTNPPYKYAKQFVQRALDIVAPGQRVAMFLKLTFLEGGGRKKLFQENPPKVVYVASSRLQCGKGGDFSGSSMVAYAWFVWVKGYKGDPIIKWIN